MNIKIGMNMLLWGVAISDEHIPVFTRLKEAGFDGVEIPVTGQSAAQLAKMAKSIQDLELECTTAAFIAPEHNPVSPDADTRLAAVENLKHCIDDSVKLGSSLLIGGIYQAHKYFVGRAPSEDEWRWSAEVLHEVGEHAAQADVKLGLEFLNRFEAYLITTSAAAQRMVKEIGLDNVGILYDTHHANIEEPAPGPAIKNIEKELLHVHLSESHRGTLGEGQVNWDASFKALHEIDYNGWLTIEAFGITDPALVDAANIWRNAFESQEQLYTEGLAFIKQRLEK